MAASDSDGHFARFSLRLSLKELNELAEGARQDLAPR
jgi:hypothetical protein